MKRKIIAFLVIHIHIVHILGYYQMLSLAIAR